MSDAGGRRHRLILAGRCVLVLATAAGSGYGHDAITTKITFDREIIRLMVAHCGSCHADKKDGGTSWPLMTYTDARGWAKAMGEQVLERQMPPWGAVKGFGDFRNDKGLTEEQLELIVNWEEGGAPEGDEKDLPKTIKFPADSEPGPLGPGITVSGDAKLASGIKLAAIMAKSVADDASYQVTAELPDGDIEPLIWFQHYNKAFDHPYVLRHPLDLPAGTVIHGVPADQTLTLAAVATAAPTSAGIDLKVALR